MGSAGPRAPSVVFHLSSRDFLPSWEDPGAPQIPGPSSHENLCETPAPRLGGRGAPGEWQQGPVVLGGAGFPLFSSLFLGSPPRPPACPPHTPSQGERPATNPGSLHFASATARPLFHFHKRKAAGRAGYTASGRGRGTRDSGAKFTRPQSLLVRRLGPDWLAASGKRDLGQSG